MSGKVVRILAATHFPTEILPDANDQGQEERGPQCGGDTCPPLLSSVLTGRVHVTVIIPVSGLRSDDSAAFQLHLHSYVNSCVVFFPL